MTNKNQWISVKDMLPPPGTQVIVTWAHGSRAVVMGCYIDGEWWFGDIRQSLYNPAPSHWQPKPQPPPMPDMFEAWCSGRMWSDEHIHVQDQNDAIDAVTKRAARVIWDAAVAATKEGK